MASPVTAWSYSRLTCWERCPLQFKFKHIDKLPEEKSPAMQRGIDIHKEAEDFLTAEGDPAMPASLRKLASSFRDLRSLGPSVEGQWAFTKDWGPTGWFAKNTWLRTVLDAAVIYEDGTADVIDHKTGKKYDDYGDQLELFGLAAMSKYRSVQTVTTRLWYLDSGEEVVSEFERKDAKTLKEKWEKRAGRMFNDTTYPARPNDKCKWCSWSRSRGGPCRFG